MKLNISYRASYQYAEPAGFSPHIVRLFPRRDRFLSVESSSFRTGEGIDVQYRSDLFDNLTASCFIPGERAVLPFELDLVLAIEERNPFHFLLAPHALRIPFTYQPLEAEFLAPLTAPRHPSCPLPSEFRLDAPTPTVEALVHLNSWIHENIAYERREEGEAFSPEETLDRGSGSCRDMAVLLADALRRHGVAARLVSGFLWEPEEGEKKAENALHAWVDAYIPGAGWVGMDPTNGVFADHHRIPTAVGIMPDHIAPIQGNYYGTRTIPSILDVKLSIHNL
ncbi:MAG: hypothetical protein Fur0032_13350 [Terrimicrobiaceae bacterium]